MKLYKYQGAGNDFLIADNRNGYITEKDGVLFYAGPEGAALEVRISDICDRRYGIGADGIMLLEKSPDHDFHMTYFNSDGSGGMMCGNGGRCIVAFAADMGLANFDFDAADGFHTAQILNVGGKTKTVRLKMKDVLEYAEYERLTGVEAPSSGWFLETGTRHYVRHVEGLDAYDIVSEGRDIRYNAQELKPVGANVNFIEPTDGRVLKVRTYEKGVEDETYACGTGIVASCIAAYKAGIRPSGSRGHHVEYDVQAKRDSLKVSFRPLDVLCGVAEEVYLTGPATFVAEVTVTL